MSLSTLSAMGESSSLAGRSKRLRRGTTSRYFRRRAAGQMSSRGLGRASNSRVLQPNTLPTNDLRPDTPLPQVIAKWAGVIIQQPIQRSRSLRREPFPRLQDLAQIKLRHLQAKYSRRGPGAASSSEGRLDEP